MYDDQEFGDEEFGGGDGDDYAFEDDDQEFMAERNAFMRAGAPVLIGSTSLKNVTNPIEKFKTIVNAVYNKVKDTLQMGTGDIVDMTENIARINNIQYKNPGAYVLGYFVTKGGGEISKRRLDLAETVMDEIKGEGITLPDVIRYAVFWQDVIGK